MKAKSIVTIRKILIEEQKKSEEAYELFRENMIRKYQTNWVNNEMNETEKKLFGNLRTKLDDLNEALDEFEEYEW